MKYLYLILFLLSVPFLISCKNDLDAEELKQNNCGHQAALITCLPDEAVYNVRANGRNIGITKRDESSDGFIFHNYFEKVVLNKSGTIQTASNQEFYFKGLDCQGDIYLRYDDIGDVFRFPKLKGRLIDYQTQLYYYQPGEKNIYQFIAKSVYVLNEGCVNFDPPEALYYKLLPNDSAVTGIETYPFPTPIEIDAPQMIIIQE